MDNKTIISILVVIAVIAVGVWAFGNRERALTGEAIDSFEDCILAGNPAMESYPRQCRTEDGRLFTEEVNNGQIAKDGCYIGGCSRELCTDQADAVSTCEYREEYACYQTATCERQQNGACGWTQSLALSTCLNTVLYPGRDLK